MELEEHIGRGAFGIVVRSKSSPTTAIKYIPCGKRDEQRRLEKEYSVFQKLDHPNIVKYLGFTHHKDCFCIEMEYCERRSLNNWVREARMLYNIRTVTLWAEQLFSALVYLAEMQLVHRDIKPENILVTNDFTLKLSDFGCVKELERSQRTTTGTFVGTQRYMSPPMNSREEPYQASMRNDVYSMGLVLWEIIERRSVFSEYLFNGHFDVYNFYIDIFTKRLVALEPPDCFDALQQVVISATKFQRDDRGSAMELHAQIIEISQECQDLQNYSFEPKIDEKQKIVLKPEGIRGRFRLKAPKETDFLSSGEPSLPPFFDELSTNHPKIFSEKSTERNKLSRALVARLRAQNDIEKGDFYRSIPSMVNRLFNKKRKVTFHKYEDDIKLMQKLNLNETERLFQKLLTEDLKVQMAAYEQTFQLSKKAKRKLFSYCNFYMKLYANIAFLERLHLTTYTTTIHFECYYSIRTGQEWLLLKQETQEFMRKDLSEVRNFRGSWLQAESKIFQTQGNDSSLESDEKIGIVAYLNDIDEFCYSHLEPIEMWTVIETMKRQILKITKISDIKRQSFLPLEKANLSEKLSIENYVFQLRNPPRQACSCSSPCSSRRYPKEMSLDGETIPIPKEMGIEIYKCSSKRWQQKLELFIDYCTLFGEIATRHLGTDCEEFDSWDPKNEPLPKRPLRLEMAPLKGDYFYFLQCRNFFDRHHNNTLVLLDLPTNYRISEKIPSFDYEFNFYEIETSIIVSQMEEGKLCGEDFLKIDKFMNCQTSLPSTILPYNWMSESKNNSKPVQRIRSL